MKDMISLALWRGDCKWRPGSDWGIDGSMNDVKGAANRDSRRQIEGMPIKPNSPQNTYETIYSLQIGDDEPVVVAERKIVPFDLVDLRCFAKLDEKQIGMLRTVQHTNIVTVHDIYLSEEEYFVAYEHMPRCLANVVGNPYLNNDSLAAIVGQVW